MKLLFCTLCMDVIRLWPNKKRTCACGKASGYYKEDGLNAVYSGSTAVAIAIANEDLNRHRPVMAQMPSVTEMMRAWYITPSAYDYGEISYEDTID